MEQDVISYINPKQRKREWRVRTEGLPNMELQGNRVRHGTHRCAAIGLIRGDCQQPRNHDSLYCYYHTKALEGHMEVSDGMYPVWPLPPVPWEFATAKKNS